MTLKQFLVLVSTDVERMTRFVADSDAELSRCGVTDADRRLLGEGNAAVLQAAFAVDREAGS